jgi:hypothetical protein
VTSWFVAEEAANFTVIQGIVTMLLVALAVAVVAFWPGRWTIFRDR